MRECPRTLVDGIDVLVAHIVTLWANKVVLMRVWAEGTWPRYVKKLMNDGKIEAKRQLQ
jgi:hypothetical protein